MNYREFLSPNYYSVFNNVYLFDQYIHDNSLTINIFKILKKRKMKAILRRWYQDILNLKSLNDHIICDFMSFINLNSDFFDEEAFDYKETENEIVLIIRIRDTYYSNKLRQYRLASYLTGQNIGIFVNTRTNSIRIQCQIFDVRYNREFKDKVIYPDNNINSQLFQVLVGIMHICTKAFVEGDEDAIEKIFRVPK